MSVTALREREARFILAPLQRSLSYEDALVIIRASKLCTRKAAYAILTLVLAILLPRARYAEVACCFLVSRKLNEFLKETVKQPRPYIQHHETVKYFQKRKLSHSFPSQSIQTLSCAFWIFRQLAFNDTFAYQALAHFLMYYYVFAIALVAAVRMYRGLHYPHDIISSFFLARVLIFCIPVLLAKVAFATHHSTQSSALTLLFTCFSADKLQDSAALQA